MKSTYVLNLTQTGLTGHGKEKSVSTDKYQARLFKCSMCLSNLLSLIDMGLMQQEKNLVTEERTNGQTNERLNKQTEYHLELLIATKNL